VEVEAHFGGCLPGTPTVFCKTSPASLSGEVLVARKERGERVAF